MHYKVLKELRGIRANYPHNQIPDLNPSHKPHNALHKYPTVPHFVTEMCTHLHISVTAWWIVGYGNGALGRFIQEVYRTNACQVHTPSHDLRTTRRPLDAATACPARGKTESPKVFYFLEYLHQNLHARHLGPWACARPVPTCTSLLPSKVCSNWSTFYLL